MKIYFVKTTNFENNTEEINILHVPSFGDKNFYRDIRKFTAFFHGGKNKYRNWTNKNLYYYRGIHELDYLSNIDIIHNGITNEFMSIDEFFEYINYDRKKKRYTDGQIMKKIDKW